MSKGTFPSIVPSILIEGWAGGKNRQKTIGRRLQVKPGVKGILILLWSWKVSGTEKMGAREQRKMCLELSGGDVPRPQGHEVQAIV